MPKGSKPDRIHLARLARTCKSCLCLIPTPSDTKVEAHFSLRIGEGVLSATIVVPAGRTTLMQLLPIIQNLENAIVGRMAQEAAETGRPISCGAGCGACSDSKPCHEGF